MKRRTFDLTVSRRRARDPGGRRAQPDGTADTRTGFVSPTRPRSGSRRRPATVGGIFQVAVGAILWFALPPGSYLGINLHAVGIIVVFLGLVLLIWPRAKALRRSNGLLRRWVIPSGTSGLGAGQPGGKGTLHGVTPGDGQQSMVGDLSAEPGRPTLADVLLGAERDPPL